MRGVDGVGLFVCVSVYMCMLMVNVHVTICVFVGGSRLFFPLVFSVSVRHFELLISMKSTIYIYTHIYVYIMYTLIFFFD